MLEGYWLIVEGAAVAGPTAAGAAYVVHARRHVRKWLREPLFWDGGQPVSLVTLFAELNGEGDVLGSLRELIGGQGPIGAAELERGVRLVQGDPALCRALVLDAATDVVLKTAIGKGPAHAAAGVELAERLSAACSELGFFAFMGYLNQVRSPETPPLLPVEGLLAGGLPVAAADDEALPLGPTGGVLGVLDALRRQGEGGWLPTLARAVEELVRDWRLKKARDGLQRAYHQVGVLLTEAMRRRAPAGQTVYRNVYSPLDAYRTLQARARARQAERGKRMGWLVPSVEAMLWREFTLSLSRAAALVHDKCESFARILNGQYGPAAAGEVLYRYRHVLLNGVAPDAFQLGAVEAARTELKQAQEQATS